MEFGTFGHDKGDDTCPACLGGPGGFPEKHECGGLLHADQVFANIDTPDGRRAEAAWPERLVDLECDKCGAKGERRLPPIESSGTDDARTITDVGADQEEEEIE